MSLLWWVGLARAVPTPPSVDLDAWTVDDGLPQSSVTALAQEPDGTLVLGTFGGLARFDGLDFDVLRRDPVALGSDRFTALVSDPRGGLVVGTEFGELARIDGDRETLIPAPPHLGIVRSLLVSGDELWVGTDDRVWRRRAADGSSFDVPGMDLARQGDLVWAVGVDSLAAVDPSGAVRREAVEGSPSSLVVKDDALWIATPPRWSAGTPRGASSWSRGPCRRTRRGGTPTWRSTPPIGSGWATSRRFTSWARSASAPRRASIGRRAASRAAGPSRAGFGPCWSTGTTTCGSGPTAAGFGARPAPRSSGPWSTTGPVRSRCSSSCRPRPGRWSRRAAAGCSRSRGPAGSPGSRPIGASPRWRAARPGGCGSRSTCGPTSPRWVRSTSRRRSRSPAS